MERDPNRRFIIGAAVFLVFSILVFAAATASAAGVQSAAQLAGTRVRIVSFAFQPSTVTINAGDTVVWKNSATIAHTTTSDTGLWNSGPLNPGSQFKVTFRRAGTYSYHCSIHPFMTGSIVVQ